MRLSFKQSLPIPKTDACGFYADWLEERGDPRGELLRVIEETAQTLAAAAWLSLAPPGREVLRNSCRPEWLKPMLRMSFAEMRQRIEELDRLDEDRAIIGSASHRYRLNPRLTSRTPSKGSSAHRVSIAGSIPAIRYRVRGWRSRSQRRGSLVGFASRAVHTNRVHGR